MTESPLPSPPEPLVEILPNWLNDGDPVTVEVTGLKRYAGRQVDVHVHALDGTDVYWHTSLPVAINADGSGRAVREGGLQLGRHSAVFVAEVSSGDERFRLPNVLISIVNSPRPGSDLGEVMAQYQSLQAKQAALYDRPVRVPGPGTVEHRALCLLEGIYTTVALRFPGAVTQPLEERVADLDRMEIANATLAQIGWPTRIPSDRWSEATRRQYPMTALVVPQIWAAGFDEAAELVRDIEDRVTVVLALNRKARGRRVALVIEQRQPDEGIRYRVFPPNAPYTGNLLGGWLSGEAQGHLTSQYLAVDGDPLVRLCCELYSEALAERSEDARYLRLWSVLELLSGARVSSGSPVALADGSLWPGLYGTTSYAAPRVYCYLRKFFVSRAVDETSFVSPATDLYEAVRVWYGRRNATGHYGRLVPGDPDQVSKTWYRWASLSLSAPWAWLDSLTRMVESILQSEIAAYAPDLS